MSQSNRPHPLTATIRPQDLEFRNLAALHAVATEGTFGRAAERLGYTQSAVSQQIAVLERVVGSPVFDRPGGPRPVTLTPLGRMLLGRSTGVLDALESIAQDVQRFRSGEFGRIDIGTIQSTSTALVPGILRRLLTDRPGMEARLVERYEEQDLLELLLRGALDVTFVVNVDHPDVQVIDLIADPFVVVARAEDVADGPIPVSRLVAGPLIGQQGSSCQEVVDAGLLAAGCPTDYVFRSADNGAVIAMVRAGLGLAVLPRLAVIGELDDPRLAIRPIDPPIPDRIIRLAWRRGRTPSPAAELFITIARDVAAEMRGRNHEPAPVGQPVAARTGVDHQPMPDASATAAAIPARS